MKHQRTFRVSLLSLMLVLCMMVGLSSCNLFCQHQWTDATCTTPKTCSLCSKTEGAALGHTGGTATCSKKAVCTVCNAEYGDFAPHAFTEEIIKDETLKSAATCTSAAVYYKSCTCGAVSTNANDVFLGGRVGRHQYVGNVCSICGFEAGDIYYFNFAESFFINEGFSLKIKDFILETETDRPNYVGTQKINSVNVAELELYYKNEEFSGGAHGIFNATSFNSTAVQTYEFSALISDGYVYISANSQGETVTMRYSVDELLDNIMRSYMSGSSNTVKSALIPFVIETVLPMVESLTYENKDALNYALEHTLNMFLSFEKQSDGSVLVKLSEEKLFALNQALATKTVAEVFDTYFGVDAFDSVVDYAYEILDLKVSEIPSYVEDNGIDYNELIAKIEELLPKFGMEDDIDVNELITNSDFSDSTIGQMLFQTEDDYKAFFEENVLSTLRTKTLYELYGLDIDMKSQIDNSITQLFDCIDISFTTNSVGEFTAVHIELTKLPISGSSMSDGETTFTTTQYLSLSLDIVANGKINITWGNIVDEHNKTAAPLPDSLKEDLETGIEIDTYSHGSIYFQDKSYSFNKYFNVDVWEVDLAQETGSQINKDCGNWNYYYVTFNSKYYHFGLYYENSDSQEFFIRYYDENYDTTIVKINKHNGGYRATFESGETKDLGSVKNGTTLEEIAVELIPTIFDNYSQAKYKNVSYYYNTVTGEYAFESQHNWTYEYDMLGETCNDGYNYTKTCTNCNETYTGYRSYHNYIDRKTDFSEYGMCGGYANQSYCDACDYSYISVDDYSCNWVYTESSYGYSAYKCSTCGATKKTKSTSSEVDENCQYTYTNFYVYTINGKEVFNGKESYTYTSHGNTENYYEMLGETCEDGIVCGTRCKTCGYDGFMSYITYGHIEDWNSDSKYIYLDEEYNICGGYIRKSYCSVCNTQFDTDHNLYSCDFEIISETETSTVYKCMRCGVVLTNTYGEKNIVTISIDGKEIFRRVKN